MSQETLTGLRFSNLARYSHKYPAILADGRTDTMRELLKRRYRTAKLAGALGLLLALTLVASLALPAFAEGPPALPHSLFGIITWQNCDTEAPDGTIVQAFSRLDAGSPWTGPWGEAVVYTTGGGQAGYYAILIDYDDWTTGGVVEGATPGEQIGLFVCGTDTLGAIWGDDVEEPGFEYGGSDRLDFSVTDDIDPTGTIVINSWEVCTSSRDVELALTWEDACPSCGVVEMRFRNVDDGGGWSSWEPVAATKIWQLSGTGDGTKTVEVEFIDGADNNSNSWQVAITDDILLDTVDPTGTIIINDGDACTNSRDVELALTWDDAAPSCGVVNMRFSRNGFDWDAWEPVAATKNYQLSEGDEIKTIWVEFIDGAGNNSNSWLVDINDSITLDTTDPTGTIVINDDDATTDSRDVVLTLTSDDGDGCGVVSMQFSNNGATFSNPEAVGSTKNWQLPEGAGLKEVWVEFIDAAGNNSNSWGIRISDNITLVFGTMVINEFVSNPSAGTEWIELFNPTADEIDLTGWTIEDGSAVPDLLDGLTILAFDYLVLDQGTDFTFLLDNAGDTIVLSNAAVEMDRVAYGDWDDGDTGDNAPAPGQNQSTGRCPNGLDTDVDDVDFIVFTTPTPDAENTEAPSVTTSPATGINPDAATLNGSVSLGCPKEAAVSFEWGLVSGALDQATPVQNLTADGAFNEPIGPLTANTQYYFRAVADGEVGAELSFITLTGPPLMFIDLGVDWNIFSVPLSIDPLNNTLGDLATMGGLDVSIAYYLDPVSQTFIQALAGYEMHPCDAILINMNAAGTVPIYPNNLPTVSVRQMYNGWNLAGSAFICQSPQPVDEALDTLFWAPVVDTVLPPGYITVISPPYNQPNWQFDRDDPTPGPDMLIGKGVYVFLDQDDIYAGDTFTPWFGCD
ncbi:lamin tail domain-containing protein [Chloroflexota bacterium]